MFKFSALVAFVTLVPAVLGQVAVWGQCGGMGYQGGTVCASGSGCVKVNDYYSQCQPGAAAPAPSTTAAPPPSTTAAPPPSSAPTNTATATTGPSPTGKACAPAISPISGTNSKLPDPFLFADGTTRVTTKADWTCRAQQIISLAQGYEAGTLPGKPSSVTGSISGSSLTVSVSDGGKSISFSSTITYPSGTAPAAGWPVIIAYGGGSLPVAPGIATLNFNNDNIAQQNGQSSRGVGLFYNLYGSGHSASAMTAWAWGVSRIIDALETTPTAKLNPARVGVTGCSRNGKGAFMAGVLEQRIALTLPQESGAGGDTCWRLTAYENQNGGAAQPATQIVSENPWFSKNFESYVNNLNALPYDHHSLAAAIAPRALLSYENTDYQWLSPMSGWGCMSATRTVYQALGVPQNHGYVQVGGHSHCAFPSSLQDSAFAFQNKFLRDQDVSTNFFSTNNQFGGPTFTAANWITWSTPTLT